MSLLSRLDDEDFINAGCNGKPGFASYVLADRIARKSRRGRCAESKTAYRCRWCGQWHIGSLAPWRPRSKKKRR